jgi:hypothetical protein
MAEFLDVQLFVKENLDFVSSGNFGIGLDCLNSSPIKVTKSIQSIENPQSTTSDFSQTFRAPNTPTNSRFFKAAFNVNSVTFNATKKMEAYINVNGAFFISGNVRLNQIFYSPDEEKIEYELIFMGQTSNFSSIVSPRNLSALDMTELSHTLNYSNIQLSWAGNFLSGNIVYPLAEYGYTYNDTTKVPNIPTLAVYNATTGVKGFTNSINPLNQNQFKPFVKTKYIWDKIFGDAGYTYTSSFLSNSQIFNKLYMISSNTSSSNAEMSVTPNLIAQMPAYSNYMFTGSTDIKLTLPNEVTDTANNWNTNSSIYNAITPGATGGYTYNFFLLGMNLAFSAPAKSGGFPTSVVRTFELKAKITYANGATALFSKTAYLDVGTSGAIANQVKSVFSENPYVISPASGTFEWNLTLFQGSKVEFFCNLGTEVLSGAYFLSGELLADGPAIVDPAGLMPKDIKQIDFIKGINDRFKLMWEVDPENPSNFIIEPWVDWIKKGREKDWTDKLDRNFDVTLTPLFQSQPREIIFKDSEEGDLYNFSYQQANKETFGQLNQDSDIEIITGNREIKSMFAPVPLGPIGNSNKFLIPHFAKDTETERQPIQIKPRLMFYNGVVTAPTTWYMKNDSGSSIAQTTYPLVSQFSAYPFTSAVLDLNWTNSNQFWDVANYLPAGSGRTPITAYTTYWQNWFNFTYSPYGRIMQATFALDIDDLRSLQFNDKIFIKDSWWLPIEVKDYILGQAKQNVKVKLVKLGDDVGIRVNDVSGLGLFAFDGIKYGSNGCNACCQDALYEEFTVYGANATFDLNSILYANAEGTIPLLAGSYSDGSMALNINSRGTVESVTLCSLCDCDPVGLTTLLVCSGASICAVCCCGSYGQTIYGNGATLGASTSIYGDSVGTTTLIPFRWYGNASGTAQVGADGTTIIAFASCSSCVCGEVPPDA